MSGESTLMILYWKSGTQQTCSFKTINVLPRNLCLSRLSARMTWSKKDAPEDSQIVDIAAEVEPSLELRNGRIISAAKLPFECGREKLQEAIRYIAEGKSLSSK